MESWNVGPPWCDLRIDFWFWCFIDIQIVKTNTSYNRSGPGNTGYEKRKKIYSTKNVVFTFYDDARQTSIFCFFPRKYAIITRKSIQLYSSWFSEPTIPIFSPSRKPYKLSEPEARPHDSIIPIAERSGAKFSSLKNSLSQVWWNFCEYWRVVAYASSAD